MSRVLPTRLVPKATDVSDVAYSAIPQRMTDEQKTKFLELVLLGASQHVAASRLQMPFLLVRRERVADEQFDADLTLCLTARVESLEELAIEFATTGVEAGSEIRSDTPVLFEGVEVGRTVETKTTRSREFGTHSLLQFLLKGAMRDKYGTERHETKDLTEKPPTQLRSDTDAQRLLKKLQGSGVVIEGVSTEVKPQQDGSDLV